MIVRLVVHQLLIVSALLVAFGWQCSAFQLQMMQPMLPSRTEYGQGVRLSTKIKSSTSSLAVPTSRRGISSRVKDVAKRIRELNIRRSVESIESLNHFRSTLEGAKEVVAVMFHVSYCKACQKSKARFKDLARSYPQVRFVHFPVARDAKPFLEEMGVRRFPVVHIYDPELGLVGEQPLLSRDIPDFEEKLKICSRSDQ